MEHGASRLNERHRASCRNRADGDCRCGLYPLAGRPAQASRPVREKSRGQQDLRRTKHVHTAEGQPVRSHPDNLRQLTADFPLHHRKLFQRELSRTVLQHIVHAQQLLLHPVLRRADYILLLLLHGSRLQPDRHRQQHEEVRRLHSWN